MSRALKSIICRTLPDDCDYAAAEVGFAYEFENGMELPLLFTLISGLQFIQERVEYTVDTNH